VKLLPEQGAEVNKYGAEDSNALPTASETGPKDTDKTLFNTDPHQHQNTTAVSKLQQLHPNLLSSAQSNTPAQNTHSTQPQEARQEIYRSYK
jgi:hypothetical protein